MGTPNAECNGYKREVHTEPERLRGKYPEVTSATALFEAVLRIPFLFQIWLNGRRSEKRCRSAIPTDPFGTLSAHGLDAIQADGFQSARCSSPSVEVKVSFTFCPIYLGA